MTTTEMQFVALYRSSPEKGPVMMQPFTAMKIDTNGVDFPPPAGETVKSLQARAVRHIHAGNAAISARASVEYVPSATGPQLLAIYSFTRAKAIWASPQFSE